MHVVATQGNSLVVETAAGVVFVDSGNAGQAALDMIEDVRKVTDLPIRAVVYSHGHMGYNSGIAEWNAHCEERGDDLPCTSPTATCRSDKPGTPRRGRSRTS